MAHKQQSALNFDYSEYEYDEPIPDIDNMQTELDKHKSGMDNIQMKLGEHNNDMGSKQTEHDQHNSDMDNIKTEFVQHNSDMDNIQTELYEHNCGMDNIPMNLTNVPLTLATHKLNSWPIWITCQTNLTNIFLRIKVIGITLQTRYGSIIEQCNFKVNHICFTFATLNLVNKRFNRLTQKCKDNLPRTY